MRICSQCGNDIQTENCPFCEANPDLINSQMAGENEQNTELPAKEPERVPAREKCPDCGAPVQEGGRACVSCGLIFFTKPAHRVDKSQIYTKRAEDFSRKIIGGLLTGIIFVFL